MIAAIRRSRVERPAPRGTLLTAVLLAAIGLLATAASPLVPTLRAADPTTPTPFLSEGDNTHHRSVHATAAPAIPTGFSDTVIITGRTNPMTFRFDSSGRVFVGEKSGRIWMYDSVSDTTPVLVADLRSSVYDYWDRGLMSIALDPSFPSNPYLYVLYAYDARIGDGPPAWSDVCPTPPGPTTDGCVNSSRLSRLTLNGSFQMTAENVLINDWCEQYPSHSVGDIRFGDDGALYASGGDGASFTFADYGQGGGGSGSPTEPNPCGDPPGGNGVALSPPTAEGGALRSQSLQRASGPAVLGGTIIRVNPSNGSGLADNPLNGSSDPNARRIVGQGLRNPFRFAIRPGTNDLWIGDVGWGTWEEIHRLSNPSGSPVENFGWPCYEGSAKQGTYDGLNLTICEDLYAAGGVVAPYYAYNHANAVVSGESCPTGSSSVSGVAFYNGGPYPSAYDGALFFADHSRNCIWAMLAGGNGLPDTAQRLTFVASAGNPVDLEIGPNGDLFYADLEGGTIHRITYTSGNQTPISSYTATPSSGQIPLLVQFNGAGSSDPDGDSLTYAWDLDGDGQYDDGTGVTASRTYDAVGSYATSLRVTDPGGKSATSNRTINASNAPVPVIDLPTTALRWKVGDPIAFSGHASDAQDGTLPASGLSWTLVLQHCPSNCHVHQLQTMDGVAAGSFAAPDHDYPSHLELTLTATDSDGLQASTTVRLDPRTVDLTFTSNPAGLQIAVSDYQPTATPFTRRVIAGSANSVSAVEPQTLGEVTYIFQYWADGGGQTRMITAPVTAKTYTATFAPGNGPGDASNVCSSTLQANPLSMWLTGTVGVAGDVDWYRFTVPSTRAVQVTLGDMPANLRLDLYSSCGTLLATSDRSGAASEEIVRRLAAGTYRVRISGPGGAWSTDPYALRVRVLASNLTTMSSSSWVGNDGALRVVGEILNTSTASRRAPRVTVTLYDSSNHVLATKTVSGLLDNLRSLYRTPFLATFTNPPTGVHHYALSVTASTGTSRAVSGLSATSAITTSPIAGKIERSGSLKNSNSFAVRSGRVVGIIYDGRGGVFNVGSVGLPSIAARASRAFVMTLDDRPGTYSHWSVKSQAFR